MKKRKTRDSGGTGKIFAFITFLLVLVFAAAFVAFAVMLIYTLSFNNSWIESLINNKYTLIISIIAVMILTIFIVMLDLLSPSGDGKGKKGKESGDGGPRGEDGESRFEALCRTDGTVAANGGKLPVDLCPFDDDVTLEGICESFRNFAASRLHLYYDIQTVRCFIAGLSVTRLIIMQGISGTGKTSLACAFADFIRNEPAVVPVQPSWKERTDLLGYFNEFTKTYNETPLLQKIYEAGYSDSMYVTVLDEMNIARVEYYFAEFLSLLEIKDEKKRRINIVSGSWKNDPQRLENGRLLIPDNMWYIGTANNDDSTMAISDKVCDRAMILDLDRRAQPFEAPDTDPVHISYDRFMKLCLEARGEISLSEKSRARIDRLDAYLTEKFGVAFGNRIMMQIEEFVPVYVRCGGTEEEATDYILAKKVLRKLEAKNPLFVKRELPGFIQVIDELFGEGSMPVCRKALSAYDV